MKRVIGSFRGVLPAYLGGLALMTGAVSTYWDIATHVDSGRERFLTPAHLGIYSSVTLALSAILLAMAADRSGAAAGWWGALRHPFTEIRPGLGVAGSGMFTALAAAPLDNAWHEIYGIDVTIWSPPHLLAIFGIAVAALGLSSLISPVVTGRRIDRAFYPLLSGFLVTLLITTAEFEFNGPQYRIAFHPMILAATVNLVLIAASTSGRWGATKVALCFEALRLLSVLFLVILGHSLPFVPLLIPGALVIDVLATRRTDWFFQGIAATVVLIAINATLLQLLSGLTWEGSDLLVGSLGALVAGQIAAWMGHGLGRRLAGTSGEDSRVVRPTVIATMLLPIFLLPGAASAHEVGGDAGVGTIEWSPEELSVARRTELRISELKLVDDEVRSVSVEARRAQHRINVPLEYLSFTKASRRADGRGMPWRCKLRHLVRRNEKGRPLRRGTALS